MNTTSSSELDAHAAMLAEKVFQTETLWPHFRQLLRDVRQVAETTPEGATVVSLERTLLYGGISLFAPFFERQNFISIDCSPESADARGAYNRSMVDDPRCIAIPCTHRAAIEDTGIDDSVADLVLVPNLVHHVGNQQALFAEMARITRPGGAVYVFEPLVRELHQMPDDFLRYTPFGMQRVMREAGLVPGEAELEGGPFSVIAYCWTQALQYFPEDKREEMEHWFFNQHFPELMKWDDAYPENNVRQNTTFPMSFAITADKPES
jgi:SAM-dependent methyltransferase